ncbi:hypothetical protein Mapa_009455 [Marchantia paleacea]|nr:hypothetical protein Mapa_009455 [Marchantia paleacea]
MNESGKPVQTCEKTENLLRTCAGSDWDRERLNAEGLLRCLSEEYVEEEKQRRGLLKRWPEAPCTEDAVSSSNAERYIPEVLLRDDDDDSFHFLQTYVRRCVNQLRHTGEVDQLVHDGQHEIVDALWRLSDQGVIEAIPGLLEKVERKALLAIYSIVSGKNGDTRNRAHLVDRNVMSAAGKLKGMMRQKIAVNTKSSGLNEKKDLRESMQVELEAVLRLSSHLQQITYNLREFSGEVVFSASESEKEFSVVNCSRKVDYDKISVENGQMQQRSPEGGTSSLQDAREVQGVVPTFDNKLDDEMEAALSKQIQVWSYNQTLDSLNEESLERTIESQNNCRHEAVSPEEAKALKDVTRIGDEAAGVGYTLIGCALEEMSRLSGQSFIAPVRSYLRSGVKRPFQESELEVEQDQVSIILSVAQTDSRISSRTMDRVRRRLVR